jgi:hypothetical protein
MRCGSLSATAPCEGRPRDRAYGKAALPLVGCSEAVRLASRPHRKVGRVETDPVGLLLILAWSERGAEQTLRADVELTCDTRRGFSPS